MTITIVKQGIKPHDITHHVTCRVCHSELKFQRGDAELVMDQRDGDYIKLNCPSCNYTIRVVI